MSSLLVLGGARSGKSRYAQIRAERSGLKRIFIATAQAFDAEMRDRIARHQEDRGPEWQTIEAPLDLPEVIVARSAPDTVLLIDCLTLWASNVLLADADTEKATKALIAAVRNAAGQAIFVSNEVGSGIVPDNALARQFRDLAGSLNQRLAECVDEVQLIVAGLPLKLK